MQNPLIQTKMLCEDFTGILLKYTAGRSSCQFMKICGLNKTTLLDYPDLVAATVFLAGCNFRCPFCHNRSLVLEAASCPSLSQEEILTFLKKRQGILDGVCITGGEPTLNDDLENFLFQIRQLGYKIKLDTNGSRPDILKYLTSQKLIDKIAMDIKSSPENYSRLCGLENPNLEQINQSIAFLLGNTIDYEFRTTVVRELHTEEDFQKISLWIQGAKACYLQAYKDSEEVIKPGFSSYSRKELENFRRILLNTVSTVEIRGMD